MYSLTTLPTVPPFTWPHGQPFFPGPLLGCAHPGVTQFGLRLAAAVRLPGAVYLDRGRRVVLVTGTFCGVFIQLGFGPR